MVWPFSSTAATPDTSRAAAIRSGAAVPSRAERQRCWDARDRYFACLDANGIIDVSSPTATGTAAAAKACAAQSAELDRDCAAQWVAHFKKYHLAQHQKEQRLAALRAQGAQEMAIQGGPGEALPAGVSVRR